MRISPLLVLLFFSLSLNVVWLFSEWDVSQSDTRHHQQIADKRPSAVPLAALANILGKTEPSTGNALQPEDIYLLLETGDFDSVMQFYQLSPAGSDQARWIKSSWLDSAGQWLENDKLDWVQRSVDVFLTEYPYDLAFRALQAEWYAKLGDISAAVQKLYELVREVEPAEQGQYISRIQQMVKTEVERLLEQRAWRPLLNFAEKLLWYEPNHASYVLLIAQAYIGLQQYDQAKTWLYTLKYDDRYSARATELLDRIALIDLQAIAVPVRRSGEHYMVGGSIDQVNPVNLLIDTGASLSVISTEKFAQLNARLTPKFVRRTSINTAGGRVEAPIYQFSSFQIEGYRVSDMVFVVMELNDIANSDGLLGMNFLKQFDFQIDQNNDLLLLAPR